MFLVVEFVKRVERGYPVMALTSMRRNQISATSISIALLPRVRGTKLPGLVGSDNWRLVTALLARPLTM
jgi:hypothetical protein